MYHFKRKHRCPDRQYSITSQTVIELINMWQDFLYKKLNNNINSDMYTTTEHVLNDAQNCGIESFLRYIELYDYCTKNYDKLVVIFLSCMKIGIQTEAAFDYSSLMEYLNLRLISNYFRKTSNYLSTRILRKYINHILNTLDYNPCKNHIAISMNKPDIRLDEILEKCIDLPGEIIEYKNLHLTYIGNNMYECKIGMDIDIPKFSFDSFNIQKTVKSLSLSKSLSKPSSKPSSKSLSKSLSKSSSKSSSKSLSKSSSKPKENVDFISKLWRQTPDKKGWIYGTSLVTSKPFRIHLYTGNTEWL